MSQVLGLKFTDYGQVYYFTSGAFVVDKGQFVLVKTEQGMGMGRVTDIREDPPRDIKPENLKTIYRLANEEDLNQNDENAALSREAFSFCRSCVRERKLDMKLVDVEVFFDRSKMVFYFTAPGRIDFRDLVKDLVRQYHTRIELRQIGVRHETQMLGAIGNCGQLCCCRRFMRKFVPVTIKMAKEQNLFLNPTKISGICGRLLCCLSFEQQVYEDFHKKCPRIGRRFNTSMGSVKTLRSNVFKKSLTVLTEHGEEVEMSLDEWQDILSTDQSPPPQPQQQQKSARPSRSSRSGGKGTKDQDTRQDKETGGAKAKSGASEDGSSAPKGRGGSKKGRRPPRNRSAQGRKKKRKPQGKPGGGQKQ